MIVIVFVTLPIHGAILLACNVNVTTPVSFTPGIYLGLIVLTVDGSIDPVPFSVQVNDE